MGNYSDMSLAELRLLAKEKKISGYSALRKQELVDILSKETNDSTKVEQQSAKKSETTDKTVAPKKTVKAVKEGENATAKETEKAVVKESEKATAKEKPAQTIGNRPAQPAELQTDNSRKSESPEIGKQVRPETEKQTRPEERRIVRRVVAATNSRPENRTENRPDNRPENRTENRQDNRRENRTENRPENRTDNRTENRPDNRTDNRADNRPENRTENRQDNRRENRTDNRTENRPDRDAAQGNRDNMFRDNRQQRDAGRRQTSAQGDMGMDSGIIRKGILEIPADQNFGFLRNDNYLPSEKDVYISPAMIRTYNLSTGDVITGTLRVQQPNEKYPPLHHITKINDQDPELAMKRRRFDRLTPVFPHERLHLEYPGCDVSMRITDMFSPIGKGQRGMIVSQPKAGKTTLLKQIAKSILTNHKSVHLIILLIDERPEEVTDFKDYVSGTNAEVIYSTFDEEPEQHRRVSEMTLERAKRLVEYGEDVVILLDSITRLARAYNLICVSSGRTLSGGLDPNALFMPKKFFGAARCMKEGGSMTILATALVETGSRMDDVVFEEFKGTGNMELVLDRNLSERRIFPAIDLQRSSTRREDLLLNTAEQTANNLMRRAFNGNKSEESIEQIINLFTRTRNNVEFMQMMSKMKFQ